MFLQVFLGNGDLFSGGHVFQAVLTVGDFLFTNEEGVAGVEFARQFHGALELAGGGEFDYQAIVAEVSRDEAGVAEAGCCAIKSLS